MRYPRFLRLKSLTKGGGGKSLTTGINKGDSVLYYGKVYTVAQVFKGSDLIVIRATGKRSDINYVWAWKCRKVNV
jgi:hypothetical protein